MNYSYYNASNSVVCYRSDTWLPGDSIDTDYPVPDYLGLTCLRHGDPPDPVLFHDNVTLLPGVSLDITISPPRFSLFVALSIQDMTLDSGVECSFGSLDNTHIPIDVRGFDHVVPWELCSHICLFNTTDTQAVISITAIEVVS